MKILSELEGAVMGVVFLRGPLSPYAVRAEFERSRSSHWSGSSGAIYPVIHRLVRQGLIRAERRRQGGRVSRACTLSASGRRALAGWLGPPLPDWAAAVTFDPIRTRVGVFAALTPHARHRLLIEAERSLIAELSSLRKITQAPDQAHDRWEALTMRGAAAEIRARLSWVRAVRKEVEGGRRISRRATGT
jgi:DNA-binding PadR family transcriptional regulator